MEEERRDGITGKGRIFCGSERGLREKRHVQH